MRAPLVRAAAFLAFAALAAYAAPARAGNLTWVGTVIAATSQQVNVNAKQQTQIFLLGKDFKGVIGPSGKLHTVKYLKPGMLVRVVYSTAVLFGSYHALEIDVLPSQISIPIKSPGPGPYHP